jgi:2-octaprenyl-6-methoxyphenol hydroxylase
MSTKEAEIVVAGAGATGRLVALALASQGLPVVLVGEAAVSGPEPRTTSLGYASVRALRRLGVWERVKDEAGAVRDIAVSHAVPRARFGRGGGRGAGLSFSDALLPPAERWAGTPLAYIVPHASLSRALGEACAARDGIDRVEARVTAAEAVPGGVEVVAGDRHYRASLVVACDGARSPLRRRAGIRTTERAFGQDAVTFLVRHERPHGGVARQLFLPDGPIAALPLPGDRSSIVWSMPEGDAERLTRLSADELARAAEDRLDGALGRLTIEGEPGRFPLRLLLADRLFADRLALAGDAGHAIHPIAGLGFNLAVRDACALADVLGEAAQAGLDIGHGAALSDYDRWRRADNAAAALGTAGLARLLSTGEGVTRALTGMGFGLVQRSEGLRRALAAEAGGATGRVPSLMAG